MVNNKFTDEEILKGLNELSQYAGLDTCIIQILKAAIDLSTIKRQKF